MERISLLSLSLMLIHPFNYSRFAGQAYSLSGYSASQVELWFLPAFAVVAMLFK